MIFAWYFPGNRMHISVNRISEADFCNKQLSRIETGTELETKNRTGTWPRLITKLCA